MPHELVFGGGIYLPPTLIACFIGFIITSIITHILNRVNLTIKIAFPRLVYLSLVIIFTVIAGYFIVPF